VHARARVCVRVCVRIFQMHLLNQHTHI